MPRATKIKKVGKMGKMFLKNKYFTLYCLAE